MPDNVDIHKYLDSGSLQLFARQIVERMADAVSVAVVDPEGKIAWCGPGDNDYRHWPQSFLAVPAPGVDSQLRLGPRLSFNFPLQKPDDDFGVGMLCVLVGGETTLATADVRRHIGPILKCVEKQLEIRAELSSVRRLSAREHNGLSVLLKLDELRSRSGGQDVLQSALQLAAGHFDCDSAAVLLPINGIREIWQGDSAKESVDRVIPVLARLFAASKDRRKVLVTGLTANPVKSSHKGKAKKILSSPILNECDEVVGILALIGSTRFERSDTRFARVLATRIAALTLGQCAVQTSLTRHEMLQQVDGIVVENPRLSSAMLLIDVDKLHVVNEMHGHLAGDAAIDAVFDIVSRELPAGSLVSNLGSGAVAVFLKGSNEQQASAQALRIRENIESHSLSYEGRDISLTASAGIVILPDVAIDAAAALNTTEVAVRSAKARGGNQSVVFRDADASVMQRRTDLDQVGSLQAALLGNRFVLYGQEIRSLDDHEEIPRYEILVRMLDDCGKVVSPERFLSSAERYQMMSALDRWVVRNTMELLRQADNPLEVALASFSINVSAQSVLDSDFVDFVEAQILQSGISPDTFCFEVTETAVMRNVVQAQRFLNRLRKLGCRLALDDFGTGHCSFAYLKELSVNYIKIDGMFVRDILENPLSEAIVESVSKIAGVLNARTVAEHVENGLVASRLARAGIQFGQGYGIGKPLPLSRIVSELGSPATDEFVTAALSV